MTDPDQNLTISISDWNKEQKIFTVSIRRGSTTLADDKGYIDFDALKQHEERCEVAIYGKALYEALFPPKIHDKYQQVIGNAIPIHLRLEFSSESSELQTIPWERIFDSQGPITISPTTFFSRFLINGSEDQASVTDHKCHLLIAIANPEGLSEGLKPIDNIDEEIKELANLVAEQHGRVVGSILLGRSNLSSKLCESLKTEGWTLHNEATSWKNILDKVKGRHILHILAHGQFRDDTAVLLLEPHADDKKAVDLGVDYVPDERIKNLHGISPGPKLVFLAACESAKRTEGNANPFIGLGPKLIEARIPAVIAMQDKIPTTVAKELTKAFYCDLFKTWQVDRALNTARVAIYESDKESFDWAIPVLFMGLTDGRLLTDQLSSAGQPLNRGLSQEEVEIRAHYLEILKDDINNRLKDSLHHACLMDIGIIEDPDVTHLPWKYRSFDEQRSFTNIDEALEHYKRRMLILGASGSGKTTTLLYIAQKLILEAEKNPNAPIPLLLNLTKFYESDLRVMGNGWKWLPWQKQSNEPETSEMQVGYSTVEQWLIRFLAAKYPFSKEFMPDWIKEGRTTLLLDGLDEMNEEFRRNLISKLNSTYIDCYHDIPIVVCSRLREYQALVDQANTEPEKEALLLHLEGAIKLQPLNEAQINDYLEKTQAHALHETINNDAALHELAQTPLTLNMMVLAYGHTRPRLQPNAPNLIESRRQLFDSYIASIMQRKEYRDAGIPYNPGTQYKTPYTFNKVNKYLGWLSVRLSERMKTEFQPNNLYDLLLEAPKIQGINTPEHIWTVSLFVGLCIFLAGLGLMPRNITGLLIVAKISGCFMVFSVILWDSILKSRLGTPQSISTSQLKLFLSLRNLFKLFYLLTLFTIPCIALGAVIIAMAAITPLAVTPLSLGIIATFIAVAGIYTYLEEQRISWYKVFGVASLLLSVLGIVQWGPLKWRWEATIDVIFIVQIGSYLFLLNQNTQQRELYNFVIGATTAFLVYAPLGIWLAAKIEWQATLITTGVAFLIGIESKNGYAVPAILLFSIIGNFVGGAVGSVLATVLICLFVLLDFILQSQWVNQKVRSEYVRLVIPWQKQINHALTRFVLTKFLQFILALRGFLPLRSQKFFRYAFDILLLKENGKGGDMEFIHPMVRDHFATRALIPFLNSGEPESKSEVIKKLAIQGEAAVDVLTDFITLRSESYPLRETALIELCAIASSLTEPALENLLSKSEPQIRFMIVNHAHRLPKAESEKLLRSALLDSEYEIRLAVRAKMKELSWEPGENGLADITIQDLRTAMKKDNALLVRKEAIEVAGLRNDVSIVSDLLLALGDPDTNVRLKAAEALGRVGDAKIVPGLLTALHDSQESVRNAVEVALIRTVNSNAVPGLLAALKDTNAHVRCITIRVLRQVGEAKIVPDLLPALRDPDAHVRSEVAKTLGQLGNSGIVPDLLTALHDPYASVRWNAIEALCKIGSVSAVPGLLANLDDFYWEEIPLIINALERVGDISIVPDLLAALHNDVGVVRAVAARLLGKFGDANVVLDLLNGLDDREGWVRKEAATALGNVGDARVVPALLVSLQDSNAGVREAAAAALGCVGDSGIMPALLTALLDPSDDVRSAAVEALGRIGDTSVIPTVTAILKDTNENDDVCQAATKALGWIGNSSCVPDLLLALQDSNGEIRKSAIEALGRVGDIRAIPDLLNVLKNSDDWVRIEAVNALGQIGDTRIIPVLLDTLNDRNPMVQHWAVQALGQVGDASVVPALQAISQSNDLVLQIIAERAINQISTPLLMRYQTSPQDSSLKVHHLLAPYQISNDSKIPDLLTALHDNNADVRQAAAQALGHAGDVSVVPTLRRYLRDDDANVRIVVANALGQIGDASVVPILCRYLRDDDADVRIAVANTLGQIGDERAVPSLILRLSDRGIGWRQESRVCDVAALALQRIGSQEALSALA